MTLEFFEFRVEVEGMVDVPHLRLSMYVVAVVVAVEALLSGTYELDMLGYFFRLTHTEKAIDVLSLFPR